MTLQDAKNLAVKHGMHFVHFSDTNVIRFLEVSTTGEPIAELDALSEAGAEATAPCTVFAKHYTDEDYNRWSVYSLTCPESWYADDGWGWSDEASDDDLPRFPAADQKTMRTGVYDGLSFFGRSVYFRERPGFGHLGYFVKGDDGQPMRVTFGYDIEMEAGDRYISRRSYGDCLFDAVVRVRCKRYGDTSGINGTLGKLDGLRVHRAQLVCLVSEDGRVCYLDLQGSRFVYQDQ